MKDTNPLQLFRLSKWKKEHKRIGEFDYSGLLVYMGGQGKRKNNYSSKRS